MFRAPEPYSAVWRCCGEKGNSTVPWRVQKLSIWCAVQPSRAHQSRNGGRRTRARLSPCSAHVYVAYLAYVNTRPIRGIVGTGDGRTPLGGNNRSGSNLAAKSIDRLVRYFLPSVRIPASRPLYAAELGRNDCHHISAASLRLMRAKSLGSHARYLQ